MKNKKWILGIYFILASVFVLLNQLGYFQTVDLLSLVFTILLIPIVVGSLIHREFAGIFFPLAVLGIIYAEPLGITNLVPWTVLLIALLASIGFSILFPHRWHRHIHIGAFSGKDFTNEIENEHFHEVIDCEDGEIIEMNVACNGAIKYINSENFKKANIHVTLGGLKVYFEKAKPAGKEVEINISSTLSGTVLYIPRTWKIISRVNISLSGIEEKNSHNSETDCTAIITGNITLSGIEIIYV